MANVSVFLLVNLLASIFSFALYAIVFLLAKGSSFGTLGNLQKGLLDSYKSNLGLYGIVVPIISIGAYLLILLYRQKSLNQYITFKRVGVNLLVWSSMFAIFLEYALSYSINFPLVRSIFHIGKAAGRSTLNGNTLLLIVTLGIIAPLFEEILFRGFIYTELQVVFRNRTALIIQALLFGMWHFTPQSLFYSTIVGLILGFLYSRFRNIIIPITIHAAMNITGIIIKKYFGYILSGNLYLVLIGAGMVGICLYFILYGATSTEAKLRENA